MWIMNGCIIKFLDVQVVHNDIRKMSKTTRKRRHTNTNEKIIPTNTTDQLFSDLFSDIGRVTIRPSINMKIKRYTANSLFSPLLSRSFEDDKDVYDRVQLPLLWRNI